MTLDELAGLAEAADNFYDYTHDNRCASERTNGKEACSCGSIALAEAIAALKGETK